MNRKRDPEFMEQVYNAIKDGYSHNQMIREQVGRESAIVDHYLRYLLEAGRIEKLRKGVYVVAKKKPTKPQSEKPVAKGGWAAYFGWVK